MDHLSDRGSVKDLKTAQAHSHQQLILGGTNHVHNSPSGSESAQMHVIMGEHSSEMSQFHVMRALGPLLDMLDQRHLRIAHAELTHRLT